MTDYEAVRLAVEDELGRQKSRRHRFYFRVNLAIFLTVMLLGWIVIPIIYGPFFTQSAALTIFALSIGGLLELVLHYMAMRLDTPEGERALRERLLGRAIQAAMSEEAQKEKAKRVSRLTDDGELVEVDDWDAQESLKNQIS